MAGLVLSIGSLNADFHIRIPRRPEVSETLVGTDFLRLGGGKAANVAYLAKKLGCEARLLAHVGDDDLAEQALAPLRRGGVDLSCVETVAGCATGLAMIMTPPDGKKGIVLAPNANETWTPGQADTAARAVEQAPEGTVLVVDCEVPAFVAEAAAAAGRRSGLQVILDPSPADRISDALLGCCDLVLPNPSEAKTLTGCEVGEDPRAAAQAGRQLRRKGPKAACIKLADGGCVLVEAGAATHVRGTPVEVDDTTGAGDAFAGGLAVALAEGRTLRQAARFATAAAHVAVTAYGSQPAYPDRRQLEAMLARLPDDCDVSEDG